MTDWGACCEQFGVWPVAQPFSGLMFDEREVALVLALGEGALNDSQISSMLGLELDAAHALAERCYHRLIVDKEGKAPDRVYRRTDFYTFLDYFIKYEHRDAVPMADRRAILKISAGVYRQGRSGCRA